MALELLNDPYETEFPALVNEVLTHSTDDSMIWSVLTDDGYCVFMCNRSLFVWRYDGEEGEAPHAFRMNMPGSGLKYTTRHICVYKQADRKMPSILVVSPEGVFRHWAEVGQGHKDLSVDLHSEVVQSIIMYEAKDHVHRFLCTTTTSTFYIVEVFHDAQKQAEHISIQNLELNTHLGLGKRMSVLLFGSTLSEKEMVQCVKLIKGEVNIPDVELMVAYHSMIRFFSMSQQQHIVAVPTHEFLMAALRERKLLNAAADNINHNILDAVPLDGGVLMVISVHVTASDRLQFYLAYLKWDGTNKPKNFASFMPIELPPKLTIVAPLHNAHLPTVRLYLPCDLECVIVFPTFVVLVSQPVSNYPLSNLLDVQDEQIVGSGLIDGLCHVVLKKKGVCALRRLPRNFDLNFWKRNRTALHVVYGDFQGKDHDDLAKAFFAFVAKDVSDAETEFASLRDLPAQNFSRLVYGFVLQFLDHEPINDNRWIREGHGPVPQGNNAVAILGLLNEKLQYYKMMFLFLNVMNTFDRMDVFVPELGDRYARTYFVELGEKVVCLKALFEYITRGDVPVVSSAVKQLAKVFSTQYDHPANRNLNYYDHFFKEVSHFEDFIPELVKVETEELDECPQDIVERARIINEVGTFLELMVRKVESVRASTWTAAPTEHTACWTNEPRIQRYLEQHMKFAISILANDEATLEKVPKTQRDNVINQVDCLARLVLADQERPKRNNNPIIASLYDVKQHELALELAEEFEDFNLIIRHAHAAMTDEQRKEYIADLKERFKGRDFDLILYDYYRRNGMVEYLLEEKGDRLETFLRGHENINWIRNVEKKRYPKARDVLTSMMMDAQTVDKKATIAGLAKLCALCEDEPNAVEISELTQVLENIEHQEKISDLVIEKVNPSNRPMTVQDIIEAYLMENDFKGQVKALLLVVSQVSSPTGAMSKAVAAGVVRRIYTKALSLSKWAQFSPDPEQFEVEATASNLSIVLTRVFEFDLSEREKRILLPNVDDLPSMISLPEPQASLLKNFLANALSALNFCLDEANTAMET